MIEEKDPRPTWRIWTLSIIIAIALSVMATLLLGGRVSFQPAADVPAGSAGSGHRSGDACCPPAGK